MKKFEELNATNSTIFKIEAPKLYGKYGDEGVMIELRTTKDPIISDDGKTYSAPAVDAIENSYLVTWEVIDSETTDESEACDWDRPISVAVTA